MFLAGGSERLILNGLLLFCVHIDPYRHICGRRATGWLFPSHQILMRVSQGCSLLQPCYRHNLLQACLHPYSCRGEPAPASIITNHEDGFSMLCDLVTEANSCSLFQWHQVHLHRHFSPEQEGALEVHPFIISTSCPLVCTVRQSQSTRNRFFQVKNRPENKP